MLEKYRRFRFSALLRLSETSRQLRNETTDLVYSSNNFWVSYKDLEAFVKTVPRLVRDKLKVLLLADPFMGYKWEEPGARFAALARLPVLEKVEVMFHEDWILERKSRPTLIKEAIVQYAGMEVVVQDVDSY